MDWKVSMDPDWERNRTYVVFSGKPFSEGACRYAYQGLYTKLHPTQPHGKKAIVKKLKDFTVWKREEWDEEIKLAKKAKELIEAWNSSNRVSRKYEVLVPEIQQVSIAGYFSDFSVGEWVSVEPYIEGEYVKWNSNSGWFQEHELSIHSFCHWTYHYSGGNLIFCDAQGVRREDSYCITDPSICSLVKGQYGMTDCGERAIAQWFKGHICNEICDAGWKRHAAPSIAPMPVVKASTYTWQTKLC